MCIRDSHQPQATVLATERFQQQTAVEIETTVQDEGRLERHAHGAKSGGGSSRPWIAVAQTAQGALVVGPAFAHLDPGLQEHLTVEQAL